MMNFFKRKKASEVATPSRATLVANPSDAMPGPEASDKSPDERLKEHHARGSAGRRPSEGAFSSSTVSNPHVSLHPDPNASSMSEEVASGNPSQHSRALSFLTAVEEEPPGTPTVAAQDATAPVPAIASAPVPAVAAVPVIAPGPLPANTPPGKTSSVLKIGKTAGKVLLYTTAGAVATPFALAAGAAYAAYKTGQAIGAAFTRSKKEPPPPYAEHPVAPPPPYEEKNSVPVPALTPLDVVKRHWPVEISLGPGKDGSYKVIFQSCRDAFKVIKKITPSEPPPNDKRLLRIIVQQAAANDPKFKAFLIENTSAFDDGKPVGLVVSYVANQLRLLHEKERLAKKENSASTPGIGEGVPNRAKQLDLGDDNSMATQPLLLRRQPPTRS